MACPLLPETSMILTLLIVWVLFSVVFFGSIAVAASRPLPPLDIAELANDPDLQRLQAEMSTEAESVFHPAAHPELETVQG
jgi:hypothetical protein